MNEDDLTNADTEAAVRGMPWWLVLVWGILAVIIGLMLITTPLITTYYLVLFMGAYWFAGGIITLVSLFTDKSNMGWKIFLSVISIIAGIAIMAYPLYGEIVVLTMLVFIIGFWGLLIGGTKLYEAFRAKDAGSGILGLISIVFGIILIIFPWGAALALPLIAGVFALIAGISSIVVAFQVKKQQA
ncbi:HdeD family acid-resistance protein [Methanospirillum sp.]|uniref:HdeD family acid-resistance protein n=1 Tax=Methanospirillum sp. TaxID=45200 RepID=UPI0035A11C33